MTLLIGLAVSAVLFAAVELMPGDAATRILGQNATPERVEALRGQLRLDDNAAERYGAWLGGLARGDLGTSVVSQQPVWSVIRTPLRNSAVLGALAFVGMSITALGLGIVAGRRPGSRADRVISTTTSAVASVPDFVLGGVLIVVFASWLDLLPAVSLMPVGSRPWDRPAILVLPVVALSLVGGAFGARLIRAIVADASTSPHVEAAELAGIAPLQIARHHLLPSLVGPMAQVLASLVPYAVGGTIVIEQLFGYPGIGAALVGHLGNRDVSVVEAIGLGLTATVLAAFLTADIVGAITDPRSEEQGPTA